MTVKPCQYNTRLRLSLASLVDASPRGGIPKKWDQDPGVGPWGGTQDPGPWGGTMGCDTGVVPWSGTIGWYHGVGPWDRTLRWDHWVGPWGETMSWDPGVRLG